MQLTEWFRSQIGIVESPPGSNNVKYNTDYYGSAVSGDSYPWCVTFIWDGFRIAGLSQLFCGGQKTAYCPFVESYARSHGQWVTSGYKEGDLLLYDWNGDGTADHIGYCAGTSGSSLICIEGNLSDKVQQVTRSPATVRGAYRPRYSDADPTPSPSPSPTPSGKFTLPVLRRGSKGETVRAAQILLAGRGYSVGSWGADGDFGSGTYAGVTNFQSSKGLSADGVIGEQTWRALLGLS